MVLYWDKGDWPGMGDLALPEQKGAGDLSRCTSVRSATGGTSRGPDELRQPAAWSSAQRLAECLRRDMAALVMSDDPSLTEEAALARVDALSPEEWDAMLERVLVRADG